MKPPKKSENLEIRLSHQDKMALQDKASQEGRSVSAVVRSLISNYLAQPVARSNPNYMMELFMTLKSKPKAIVAAACALIASPLLFSSFAAAQPIAVMYEMEYVVPVIENGVEGTNTRRATNEVHLTKNEQAKFPVMGPQGNIFVSISVTEIADGLTLKFTFSDVDKTIAAPVLTSYKGETVSFLTEGRDGTRFTLTATPEYL